ncbi:MAG TPA: DNA recombination protein RmuC [Chthoniobacterales bacterium]|nr:DNA recombination protein RmuC [Chthoniobacterales bacterium]
MSSLVYLIIGLVAGILSVITVLFLRRRARNFTINSRPVEDELIRRLEMIDRALHDEFSRNREEASAAAKNQREELGKSLEGVRGVVDLRLKELQQDNATQIDKMRSTVDEKLQGTLEKRLTESFKQVSDGLARMFEVSGEMKTLALGVGDLKRVLTNVKTRGGWGEWQLGVLLEDILPPDRFARNVRTREGSNERVDFAIKLPGDANGEPVWLPIDAKFPREDYDRLTAAQERADLAAIDEATKNLEIQLKRCAKDICDKYLNPPVTTDFAIMFLPTEGLYAEAVRRAGLIQQLQRDCRVTFAGPTTLSVLLNSFQMGFRTLAIQKRSSEVWSLLATVKAEFGKFGEALGKVKSRLDQASSDMEKVATRSRVLTKKLDKAGELPPSDASVLLKDLVPETQADEQDLLGDSDEA